MRVEYRHPVTADDGKRLSLANIIWAERDRGSQDYRVSAYAERGGKFPANHPCAPFDDAAPQGTGEMGGSKRLTAFRQRGYWASCFPEGDGITLRWWDGDPEPPDRTPEQVAQDIRQCFGWEVSVRR